MQMPKVIIFDVNETLLDLAPLRYSVGQALPDGEQYLSLWFSTMLHYSLVETLSGDYHGFGEIGTAALMMVAASKGIELDPEVASEAIAGTITKLPAHPDVVPALQTLAKLDARLVSLSNSSKAGLAAQFEYAGLTKYFDRCFSVEDVRAYKPDPRPYRWVLEQMGVQAEDALMVAAHAWDLAGAKAVGMQTAFIQRPGAVAYPLGAQPDYIVKNLPQLVDLLDV
ncbi:haloacid dehalogenase type II [Zhongshania arctica]|uniref:(S)-2-haloacid dehalogenase n=1 Tax=Zhongshania arctica TaxID=3238302 RepID=A0ABV3TUK5_9GAMM